MQTPSAKTPVPKCIRSSLFTQRMIARFNNSNLAALATKLAAANDNLAKAQNAYGDSVTAMIPVRVDVRFADYVADEGVRSAQRAAEVADGKKAGKISSLLFPLGITPIVRPVGETEVNELRDLEGRYDTVVAIWPEAAAEKAKIVALRRVSSRLRRSLTSLATASWSRTRATPRRKSCDWTPLGMARRQMMVQLVRACESVPLPRPSRRPRRGVGVCFRSTRVWR
jgi:hypothetical protein